MEFWGVEVKAGEPLKVTPDMGSVIHISQAALGEGKKEKGNDIVSLRVKIDGKKLILGSLSAERFPQVTFDLVFEKEFELLHDWKNGSVYFCGYSADNRFADDEDDFGSEDSDEDEDIPLGITQNGKIESKVEEPKPVANKGKTAKPESSAKPKVPVSELKNAEGSDESEDEDESDEDMLDSSDDGSDSEDEDDEEEETPKKTEPSKKRPIESATKTPLPSKKAKLDTPQKTDGKKGGVHTATPHPSKQAGKNAANSNKSKEQTPKSEGKVVCNSCTRTFNSDKALESHSKAKHGSK